MVKQKQRKARDKKTQDTDMNPKEGAQLEAYIISSSQFSNAFALSLEGGKMESKRASPMWFT